MPLLTSSRRHLRSIAAWTLLAWVLALGAGVARACLLEPYVPAAAQAIGAGQHSAACADATGAGAAADAQDAADASMAGCLKFCDESSSTVAKSGASGSSLADLSALVVLAGLAWQPTDAVVAALAPRAARPAASRGPPLFLRLLRLTI